MCSDVMLASRGGLESRRCKELVYIAVSSWENARKVSRRVLAIMLLQDYDCVGVVSGGEDTCSLLHARCFGASVHA